MQARLVGIEFATGPALPEIYPACQFQIGLAVEAAASGAVERCRPLLLH